MKVERHHKEVLTAFILVIWVGASADLVAVEPSADLLHPLAARLPEQADRTAGAGPVSAAESEYSMAFLGPTPGELHGNTSQATLQVAIGLLAALLVYLALVLLQCAGEQADDSSMAPSRKQQAAPTVIVHSFLAFAAASAMSIDGAVAMLVAPLLPHLSGSSLAPLLFFLRPVVAIVTAAVLLPAWIPTGAAWGHLVTGIGLMLLSVSCLFFASATSVAWALVGQLTNAVASATIFVSVMHTRVQEADGGSLGTHVGAVMGGLAVGYACAPWVGSSLNELIGLPALFVVLAWAAFLTCCVHVCIFRHTVATSIPAFPLHKKVASKITADADTLASYMTTPTLTHSSRMALGAAVLSVHNIAVPLYLQSLEGFDERALASWQGVANIVLVLTLIASSAAFDKLGAYGVTRCTVFALVLSILGFRSLAMSPASMGCIVIGLMGSLGGVGLYLGFAVAGCAAEAAHANPKQSLGLFDATVCGTLCACWFFGDAAGVVAQLVLSPLIGVRLTILVFACGLALHAAGSVCWCMREEPPLVRVGWKHAGLFGTVP